MDYICDRCGENESDFMSICEECKWDLKRGAKALDMRADNIKMLLIKMRYARNNDDLSKLHKEANRLFNDYIGDMVENMGKKEEEKEMKVIDLMARIELKKNQMKELAKEVEYNLSQYVNQTEEQKKLLDALKQLESGVVESVAFNSLVDPNLRFVVKREIRP